MVICGVIGRFPRACTLRCVLGARVAQIERDRVWEVTMLKPADACRKSCHLGRGARAFDDLAGCETPARCCFRRGHLSCGGAPPRPGPPPPPFVRDRRFDEK